VMGLREDVCWSACLGVCCDFRCQLALLYAHAYLDVQMHIYRINQKCDRVNQKRDRVNQTRET